MNFGSIHLYYGRHSPDYATKLISQNSPFYGKYTIPTNATMTCEPVHDANITNEINSRVNHKRCSIPTKITPNSEGTLGPELFFSVTTNTGPFISVQPWGGERESTAEKMTTYSQRDLIEKHAILQNK